MVQFRGVNKYLHLFCETTRAHWKNYAIWQFVYILAVFLQQHPDE